MKEYIFTLVGISLVCAFARMLSPDEDDRGVQSYIKLLCGLLLLYVVTEPITLAVSSLKNIGNDGLEGIFETKYFDEEDYEKIYNGNLIEHSEQSVSAGLEAMLINELKLSAQDIDVYVDIADTDSEFTPQTVTVVLYGGAVLTDPRDIEDYVNRVLGCECEIIYG